ncbi:PREDICTED: uncharacterized protein LOC107356819 [Acropora digitifera]|uniref:uncharacterized protein LOC107356819 n=1 Tax=Acropora digitifera TaxID=70779 RepID=UPI000779F9F7|nr:PREDICTED: uncharacterized protein LOC107356819 [Acropora digitifera]
MKKKFGDDFRVVAAYESKALSWPEVRAEDGVGLNRFSLFLMRCKNAMEGSGHLTKLKHPDTIRKLVLNLPFNMRVRWRRLVDDVMETEARAAMFADFANFVDHEARIATNPVFGRILEDARPKLDRRDARLQKRSVSKRPGELSFAAQVDSSQNSPARVATPRGSANSVGEMSCLYCNAGHALENCSSLRNCPYSERIEFLKLKGLCFGCLFDGHTARNCPQRKTCLFPNCPKTHPSVLHTNSAPQNPEVVNPRTSLPSLEGVARVHNAMVNPDGKIKTSRNEGLSKTDMAVVPVKVWVKGCKTPVVTNAFLDSGSSSTFCTEALRKQLGVSGPRTKISLTTLEKKDSLVDSIIVADLTISDLDENVFIKLPMLYTRPSIPVAREDMPTQEDVDKWPHLSGVHLPRVDAEVGLLITSDVPEVLDPLEVKHSEGGGPYASRTRVGWAVNGPLVPYPHCSRPSSFFVKADTELHRMVQDFYNRDFSESIADNHTELSQEERLFIESVKKSVELKNGHYEIALPFKDVQRPVPNNRVQAEQRVIWLKKRLEKNPELLNDYKGFVQDIVTKGYAQKVSEHSKESDCEGNTWFIPHHGIYHPHKPGKIRVVFDCSARLKGTSLNDLLMKGPDLTNSLLGVLTRFRVAVMTDIQEMFHQVRVPECDRSFLRFLWWPNGDLSRGLIEYQMTVHLFGAVSSPACSNYALRKTADDNAQHFSCDVVNTIKRNFYVDDCLKSLPSVKDAITHVRELCSLLQREGFRLTKFRQDHVAVMADIQEMFHQVRVPECDRSFLRFLWWPNGDLSRGLIEYQMTVHLFGAVSSPACSNYALRKTADDNAQHFSCDVVNTIKRNFYVDDCLKSLPSVKDAITHVRELCSLLQRGGFRLTKWVSTSREVLESIPVKDRGQEIKKLDLQKDELPVERALGVQWRIEDDTFGFNVNLKPKAPTRRGILSVVGSVFDPLVLLPPSS